MPTDLRRFTISIDTSMEPALDMAKQTKYYKNTQSEMIRDLIFRGLVAINAEATDSNSDQTQTDQPTIQAI